MGRVTRNLASAILLASTVVSLLSFASYGQEVRLQLQPPANGQLLLEVRAEGDQVYICQESVPQFVWALKAPNAPLFDKDGKHSTGSSWEATDGSRVTGQAAANVPSPDPGPIPWLFVTVVSHDGTGVLSGVTTIHRLNMKGGKAPASSCDTAHVGQEARVPYTADYLFSAPK